MLVIATLQINYTQKPKWKLSLQLFMKMPAPVREDVCAHNINIHIDINTCAHIFFLFISFIEILFDLLLLVLLLQLLLDGDDGFSTNDIFCWTLFPLRFLFFDFHSSRFVYFIQTNTRVSCSYAIHTLWSMVCMYIYKIYLLDNVVHPLNFRITLDDQCLPRHISNYPCH